MTAEWPSLLPQPGPEHRTARELARRFLPDSSTEDEAEFRAAWKRFADAGVFRLAIPEAELDPEAVLGTLEGLGEGTRNAGFLLGIGAHSFAVGSAVSRFGREHRVRLLESMRDGSVIAAFAATEPDSGSDVMSLRTRSVAVDDTYVLDGTKQFVTNAGFADWFLIFATMNPRLNWRGVTAFGVPRGTPGLSVGAGERVPGYTGCSIGSVHLDSVILPRSAMLGQPGQGSAIFRHAMLWERALLAALTVGTMRRQVAEAIRPAGVDPIALRSVVDIVGRYLIGRLLVRDSATKLAAGTLTPGEASLTKLWISEAELSTSRDLAGTDPAAEPGTIWDRTDDLLRALGGTIYSGTSDIQRRIIAAECGILE